MEKSKLVREETDAIDAAYEKKFKQAQMSQQITRSTLANKTRLRVLAARQQLLDDIFERAAQQLAQVAAKDKARLAKTYKGLILEGMYALREPQLQIRARKADYDIVRKAMEEAEKEYKATMHTETKLSIDEDDPLPDGW